MNASPVRSGPKPSVLDTAAGLSQRHAITAINLVRSDYHDRIDQRFEVL
jgi:hypothetical protein